MNYDFWYNNVPSDIAKITVSFYPSDGTYRGNMFDRDNNFIGDYVAPDSITLEKEFPGIFDYD